MADAPRVGDLIGNPRRASRTTQIAREVADQVAELLRGKVALVVELGAHGQHVVDAGAQAVSDDVEALRAAVASSGPA